MVFNPIISISYFQEHIVIEPCNVLDWQTWPTNLRPNPTLGGVDKRLLILINSIKRICMVCTFAQSESSELSVNIPMTSWITLSSYYITLSLHFRECNWKYACMGDFLGNLMPLKCLSNTTSHQSFPNASPNLKNSIRMCTLLIEWQPCKMWNT